MMSLQDRILVITMIVASAAASIAMLYWLVRLAFFLWEVL